jgi:hypothetical protein
MFKPRISRFFRVIVLNIGNWNALLRQQFVFELFQKCRFPATAHTCYNFNYLNIFEFT